MTPAPPRIEPRAGTFSLDELTPEVETLLRLIPNTSYLTGVEVGTLWARTACLLCSRRPGLHLTCVDNWDCSDIVTYAAPEEVAEQARKHTWAWRCHIEDGDSISVASGMSDDHLDFVYLDAKHDRANAEADIAAWWPKVRRGGILCGHDYGREKPPAVKGLPWDVRGAVDAFVQHEGLGLFVEGFVWAVSKP